MTSRAPEHRDAYQRATTPTSYDRPAAAATPAAQDKTRLGMLFRRWAGLWALGAVPLSGFEVPGWLEAMAVGVVGAIIGGAIGWHDGASTYRASQASSLAEIRARLRRLRVWLEPFGPFEGGGDAHRNLAQIEELLIDLGAKYPLTEAAPKIRVDSPRPYSVLVADARLVARESEESPKESPKHDRRRQVTARAPARSDRLLLAADRAATYAGEPVRLVFARGPLATFRTETGRTVHVWAGGPVVEYVEVPAQTNERPTPPLVFRVPAPRTDGVHYVRGAAP